MTYDAALARLFGLRRFGIRPGLGPTQEALAALGHPERAFAAIHVAGTNGKGSVAAMCEAALRQDRRRVGLYTSPHLSRFTERVRIDGAEIERDEVAGLVDEVLHAAPSLTFFEVVTVAAFLAFARQNVELAVIEVGLGGRLDATNTLANPLVSIITNIALDHTEILGETTARIAREKAGILRAGVPAVVGAVDDEARAVISAVGQDLGAPVAWLGRDFMIETAPLRMLGEHQRRNAAIARAALQALPMSLRPSPASIARGLAEARWPGRLEPLAEDLVVDGAHNADGAKALAAALPELAKGRPIHLVVGVVEEKDARGVLAPLVERAARIIVTRPPSPRARSPVELAALLSGAKPIELEEDPRAAVERARTPAALTVVAGSLFLVGAVRAFILGEPVDPIAVQDPAPRRTP